MTTVKVGLSLTEVAAALGISRRTVERLLRADLLVSVTIGRRRIVPVTELARVVQARSLSTTKVST